MKKAIIIPIYLRLNKPEDLPCSEGISLAKRAIESLNILEDQDFTLVLPVALDLSGEDEEGALLEADKSLRKEVGHLRKWKTLVFSSYHLKDLRDYLGRKNFKHFYPLIDLKGFSKIRNTGLLITQALSLDVAIFIDYDEVVENPRFLRIACEYLNERWNGKLVRGKGGFYVNQDGTIFLPPQPLWWRFFWNKTKWMNRVWRNILSSKDRLVPSSILLGGNLALHHHLFRRVPFDPYIPRGEDTDYLINASQLGYSLLFDKELQIKHLHPKRMDTYFQEELRWDIERFLYERRKMSVGLNINLDPYPGYFLRWTLYPKAMLTSLLLSMDYLRKREWKRAKECIANFKLFIQERNEGWLKYLNFRADWQRVMEEIRREGISEILKECWI
jgi:glycosyltransferase involved in cell wall biosynthesis